MLRIRACARSWFCGLLSVIQDSKRFRGSACRVLGLFFGLTGVAGFGARVQGFGFMFALSGSTAVRVLLRYSGSPPEKLWGPHRPVARGSHGRSGVFQACGCMEALFWLLFVVE